MQIEVKGRHMAITDELRDHVNRRFAKIGRQVSDLARLEVELSLERNPAIAERHIAQATLHLKGTILRACDASRDITHSINLASDELSRQVKRDRDKRRRRREARSAELPVDVAPATQPPAT
jgi:putative sigma-54 modulation protein